MNVGSRKKRGFTMIELIAGIIILGILSIIVIGVINNFTICKR